MNRLETRMDIESNKMVYVEGTEDLLYRPRPDAALVCVCVCACVCVFVGVCVCGWVWVGGWLSVGVGEHA